MRFKAYIYPFTSRNGGMVNPYIRHVVDALKERIDFVNGDAPSRSGLFDILRYLREMDLFFLNWPEEILEKKGGILQAVFFVALIRLLKLKKVKICWTFHNKESHNKNKARLKHYIRNFTAIHADYIITHASEGIDELRRFPGPVKARIRFFHHPVLPPVSLKNPDKTRWDLLIWGMVIPYKGIDLFLDFLSKEKISHLKVLVAGKIAGDAAYREKMLSYRSPQVEITDEFAAAGQLEGYIAGSKAVLFTYLGYSVLSSGALMDTLRYAPLIIGPDSGAFKDLGNEGLIVTYRDFSHLMSLLKDPGPLPDKAKIIRFAAENSWENFGNSVYNFILSE